MKKLSDVCKIVGVTRRTLQEYDKVGLLHPTAKTEAGYWLYDDDAIKILLLIQFFIMTGYERKTVKQLLNAPTLDIMSELDHLISNLEQERRRIDGKINAVKMQKKFMELLPKNAHKAFGKVDVMNVYKKKSYSDYWNEYVEYSTDGAKEAELFIPLWRQMVEIGFLYDKPVDAPEVVECTRSFCNYLMNTMLEDVESDDIKEDDDITPSEVAEVISEVTMEILSDPGLAALLEAQCGENTATYIFEAVKAYCSSLDEADKETWREKIEGKKHSK